MKNFIERIIEEKGIRYFIEISQYIPKDEDSMFGGKNYEQLVDFFNKAQKEKNPEEFFSPFKEMLINMVKTSNAKEANKTKALIAFNKCNTLKELMFTATQFMLAYGGNRVIK